MYIFIFPHISKSIIIIINQTIINFKSKDSKFTVNYNSNYSFLHLVIPNILFNVYLFIEKMSLYIIFLQYIWNIIY